MKSKYWAISPSGDQLHLKKTKYTDEHPPKWACLTWNAELQVWREVRQSSRIGAAGGGRGWTTCQNALMEHHEKGLLKTVIVPVYDGDRTQSKGELEARHRTDKDGHPWRES